MCVITYFILVKSWFINWLKQGRSKFCVRTTLSRPHLGDYGYVVVSWLKHNIPWLSVNNWEMPSFWWSYVYSWLKTSFSITCFHLNLVVVNQLSFTWDDISPASNQCVTYALFFNWLHNNPSCWFSLVPDHQIALLKHTVLLSNTQLKKRENNERKECADDCSENGIWCISFINSKISSYTTTFANTITIFVFCGIDKVELKAFYSYIWSYPQVTVTSLLLHLRSLTSCTRRDQTKNDFQILWSPRINVRINTEIHLNVFFWL